MKISDSGSSDFQQAPIGNHPARCFKIIDIGTQEGEWQGKSLARRQIVVFWELCNELMETKEGKKAPFQVSKWYTASLNEKATLRADLVNWRGRQFTQEELMGFDIQNIIGKPCLVSVVHNENGKAKVSAVSALPKGMEVPPQANPSFYLSLEPDEFDRAKFDSLHDFWKGKIQDTPEWHKLNSPKKGPVSNKPTHDDPFLDAAGNFDAETIPF